MFLAPASFSHPGSLGPERIGDKRSSAAGHLHWEKARMAHQSDLYSTKLRSIRSAETLCDIARPMIRAKARRLSQRPGFSASDQDDIEQDAVVRLLERFQTETAGNLPVLPFIQRVVNQSIANQIRDRFARKRDPRQTSSLDADKTGGNQGRWADQLDDGNEHLSALLDLALDVEEVISQLAADQQELCAGLGIESIAELARRFKQPRSTVQDAVRKVRRRFESSGLDGYLKDSD